jgi:formate C-acetyltransferase
MEYMNYRDENTRFVFPPDAARYCAEMEKRLKPQGVREGTHTGPEPDGKTPFLDAFESMPEEAYPVVLAHAIVNSWLESPVVIRPRERIVGVPRPDRPLVEHFSYGIQRADHMLDHPAYREKAGELRRRIDAVSPRLSPLTMEHMYGEGRRMFGDSYGETMRGLWWTGGYQGHTIPNYPKLLSLGADGLKDEIVKYLSNTAEEDKLVFYRALLVLIEGFSRYILLYAEKAAETALDAEGGERDRLCEIARICRKIAHERPQTFPEAAQLMWFHCLWDWVDCVGRMDRYLEPFFRTADRETAEETASALFFKIREHGSHNVTLGGLDPETGEDASNDLTFLLLQIARTCHDTHPRMTIRVDRKTPEALLRLAVAMWSDGMSDPTVVSDTLAVDGLRQYGVSLRDARDYSVLGCQEIELPGKSNFGCEDGKINLAKILEYTLNDGYDRRGGPRVGLPTGKITDYADIESLFEAYAAQVRFFTERFCRLCDLGQEVRAANFAKLWKSLTTDDCLARGRSLDDGGAVYNYGVAETAGSSAVGDSFAAMDLLVFGSRKISPETLEAALAADFEGYEAERLLLLSAPKFGNDADEADRWTVRVLEQFWGELGKYRSVRGGVYMGACSLLADGIWYGKQTAALPDGRHAGDVLGNTIGPRTGADKNGVTAMLKSVMKLPLRLGLGGTTLNVLIPREANAAPEQRAKTATLIRTYLENGGQMAQITTASLEDMKDAQIRPECHEDLIVRIGGYSTRFTEISREMQDELIRRYA